MDYTHGSKKHRTIEAHVERDIMGLEHQIHCMETEAYSSVLKAFIAQSDLLTWGKEGLMTDLRKELNITDVEHGKILTMINTDDSVKWIRDKRKVASHSQDYLKVNNTPGCASSSMRNSIIRLKAPPPSASFYPPKNVPHGQVSLTPIPFQSSMPPKHNDVQLAAQVSHGHGKLSMQMFNSCVQLPPIGRGKVLKGKHKLKDFHTSECVQLKNKSDLIQIRPTDLVIHGVEKMLFSREKPPGPVEIEKAKWALREQEKALIEALGKLTDVSERDDTSDPIRCYEVTKNTPGGQEMMMHGNFCGLVGGLNGLGDSFRTMPSG
ncbi:PREDICTED: protein EMSY-LIKE 2-like [Lupinus angustifolius]|uniref:protein EMSY-LIKE 2-like n=1 Tax=Lupinus angustifolius TaxID=3871 RepID=UPI00092E79E9|nr:PREDICTED: protein EMSY-LIKE 2-like [Lupinus angustifolius]